LSVCESYMVNGEAKKEVPYQMLKSVIEPVLRSFPGWKTDITQVKNAEDIPALMKNYIDHINAYLGVEISYVSNGPGRDQIIRMK
ncbi:MAG: adenylosuccinate synthetase, partial [Sphingobacteriales bacterium]